MHARSVPQAPAVVSLHCPLTTCRPLSHRDNPEDDFSLKIAAAFPPPPLTNAAAAEPGVLRVKHALFRELLSSAEVGREGSARSSGKGSPEVSVEEGEGSMVIEVLLTYGDLVPTLALAAARICCLTAAEAAGCSGAGAAVANGPLSPRNEDAALRRACQALRRSPAPCCGS